MEGRGLANEAEPLGPLTEGAAGIAVILSLVLAAGSGILLLVGLLAVGAALLLVSATFSGAVMRLSTSAAT